MSVWLCLVLGAFAQTVSEGEGAWWSMLGDVVPGRPGAQEALTRWLSLYQYSGSPRVEAVRALLDAQLYQDHKAQLKAFELARASLLELERRRTQRRIARLGPRDRREIDMEWLEGGYAQLTAAPVAAAVHDVGGDPRLAMGLGGTAWVGVQTDLLDLEGLLLMGASIDRAYSLREGEPVVRGELAAGVGGDGVLLFAGAGLSNQLGLHQFGQLELTNDGDGLWLVLALRVQAEETLGEEATFGVRGLAQIGFKFGETPD